MDKISKLSQAIKLGATFRPQCRNVMFDLEGRSCALGAAYEALTGRCDTPQEGMALGYCRYQYVAKRFDLPVAKLLEVQDMNDVRRMTREAIADQLEQEGL